MVLMKMLADGERNDIEIEGAFRISQLKFAELNDGDELARYHCSYLLFYRNSACLDGYLTAAPG